jgi:hypothetical protein
MTILSLLLIIIVVGFLLYLVNRLVPMEASIKMIFNVVIILVLVVWLMKAFGLWAYLNTHF